MPSTIGEYRTKISKIHEYLGGRCVKCGSDNDLQIDHIDHFKKKFTISTKWGLSWDKLIEEIDKCQLLCRACHLEKTINEGSLSKGESNKPNQKHGTIWSYFHYHCRCDKCVMANLERNKLRRKSGDGPLVGP